MGTVRIQMKGDLPYPFQHAFPPTPLAALLASPFERLPPAPAKPAASAVDPLPRGSRVRDISADQMSKIPAGNPGREIEREGRGCKSDMAVVSWIS